MGYQGNNENTEISILMRHGWEPLDKLASFSKIQFHAQKSLKMMQGKVNKMHVDPRAILCLVCGK
jgi:hypothetical protein